jgi:hypothetical protein
VLRLACAERPIRLAAEVSVMNHSYELLIIMIWAGIGAVFLFGLSRG